MSNADDPQSNGAFFTACLVLLLGLIALVLVLGLAVTGIFVVGLTW